LFLGRARLKPQNELPSHGLHDGVSDKKSHSRIGMTMAAYPELRQDLGSTDAVQRDGYSRCWWVGCLL